MVEYEASAKGSPLGSISHCHLHTTSKHQQQRMVIIFGFKRSGVHRQFSHLDFTKAYFCEKSYTVFLKFAMLNLFKEPQCMTQPCPLYSRMYESFKMHDSNRPAIR